MSNPSLNHEVLRYPDGRTVTLLSQGRGGLARLAKLLGYRLKI